MEQQDYKKVFVLYLDRESLVDVKDYVFTTYDETTRAINEGLDRIRTTSLASLGFYLNDLGYKILVVRNGISKEFYPGMDSKSTDKEIRKGHNIMRLIMGRIFNKDFE